MAKFTLTELPKWVTKVELVAQTVIRQSAADLLFSIEPGPSITREGYRLGGTIPVDLGALVNSLQSSLYGSTSIQPASGPGSYVLVAGAMKVGDVARFAWGGPAAPYARKVHDGSNGVAGTHWIDAAANRWPSVVKAAVAKAKAELQ